MDESMLQTFPTDTIKQSSPTTKTINLNFLDSLGNINIIIKLSPLLILLLLSLFIIIRFI